MSIWSHSVEYTAKNSFFWIKLITFLNSWPLGYYCIVSMYDPCTKTYFLCNAVLWNSDVLIIKVTYHSARAIKHWIHILMHYLQWLLNGKWGILYIFRLYATRWLLFALSTCSKRIRNSWTDASHCLPTLDKPYHLPGISNLWWHVFPALSLYHRPIVFEASGCYSWSSLYHTCCTCISSLFPAVLL